MDRTAAWSFEKIMEYDEATAEAKIKFGMFSSRARISLKLFLFTNIAFSSRLKDSTIKFDDNSIFFLPT